MSLLLSEGISWWILGGTVLVPLIFFIINKLGDDGPKNKKLPPKFPISILRLGLAALFDPKVNFQKLFARFGQNDPLSLAFWPWPKIRILTVNDFDLAKQLFNLPIFNGRPENEFWQYYTKGNYGIVSSYGKVWEEQRRFTLRKLKDMGMGHKSMETLIDVEVENFLDALAANKGKVFSPNKMPSVPILNTIWVVLTGHRFQHGVSAESKMIDGAYEAFSRVLKFPQCFLLLTQKAKLPLGRLIGLVYLIPFRNTLGIIVSGFDNLRNYCTTMILERRKMLAEGHPSESFIDDYLQEIEVTSGGKSSFQEDEGVMNLQATITDFLVAGGDTAANTLSWSMLHLIRNPEVQQKIQAEIDTVVGRERRPNLSDRPNCPYSTAFLLEVLRSTPVGLFSLPHMTTEDTEVGGYFIPKNTITVVNIAAIHASTKIWGDPKAFRPERFLSEDGKTVVKNEAMVAFSIGKRKCPGAALALDNLYLFLSAICQRFTLRQDPKQKEPPSLNPVMSMLNSPQKFYMVVEERA